MQNILWVAYSWFGAGFVVLWQKKNVLSEFSSSRQGASHDVNTNARNVESAWKQIWLWMGGTKSHVTLITIQNPPFNKNVKRQKKILILSFLFWYGTCSRKENKRSEPYCIHTQEKTSAKLYYK